MSEGAQAPPIDPGTDLLFAEELEPLTRIPAGTWRYYAHAGIGPGSFKLGRRRVWRRSSVLAWVAEREAAALESA